MTLVFRTSSGSLQQTQVNRSDIIATASSIQSAWGFIGGLDGIQRFFQNLNISVSKRFKDSNRFRIPSNGELSSLAGQIFTSNGPQSFFIENPGIFGGDFASQIVGLSVCAIAHECGGQQAVHLFIKCLAPALFAEHGEFIDALYALVNDNWQRIINEGAARSLTTLFTDAVSKHKLPPSDRKWLQDYMASESKPFPAEINMVGGLLKWICLETRAPYFTRSSLVARVAVCLREAGYIMKRVVFWNGSGNRKDYEEGTKFRDSVILVTGGSTDTDTLILSEDEEIPEFAYVHHYSLSTVGAMFTDSTFNQSDIPPDSFQSVFERVYGRVQDHLSIKWTAVPCKESTEA